MKSLMSKVLLKISDYFLGFEFKYFIAHVRFKMSRKVVGNKQYDLIFISPEKGWIIDGICKEIDKYYSGRTAFRREVADLPTSRIYFFPHYTFFCSAILSSPHILGSINIVYYTHPRDVRRGDQELIYVLNLSTMVFTMNSACSRMLQSMGLKPSKVQTLVGAADKNLFIPIVSKAIVEKPCIGFCLGFRGHQHYRERKNYDLIIELVKIINDANVVILGKDWSQYERFCELRELPYFHYIEVPYDQYPTYYQQMDVFVSVSKLEGGPIPLIEAMMCNVFPVVSNTGFAPDIITHGENGFLFDVDASAEAIYELIKQALTMKVDVRKTVEHLTWENFSQEIQSWLTDKS